MKKFLTEKRRYSLAIWALGLGYFISYTPYSGLTKALSNGLLPGAGGPVKGPVLLPLSAIATVVGMFSFITIKGWWKYAGRREFFGVQVPFPRLVTFLSGVCLATIMGTTTLAFSFAGLSIVLVLVLLRGGTLIIAPVVDRIVGRRVRWFSWTAMFVSLAAVLMVLSEAPSYTLTLAAVIDIAAYLAAYFFKLQFMSRLAKTNDRSATLRYFVEEQIVASPLLVLTLIVLATIGYGDVMQGFRTGLTSFVMTPAAFYAVLVGLSYAALCVCTTLIFLDRRENTFCMPMHCGSSMLAGFTATAILAVIFNQSGPTAPQTISSAFLVVALIFLSPLHHFDRYYNKLKRALGLAPPLAPQRLFLFVCSGNTCRSPMAAAIANAEIAKRLGIPVASLETVNIRAMSAGVTARVGAPLTPEAVEVLREFDVPVKPHAARNLTPELASEAELIFCMTKAQRQAVIEMLPQFAGKTYCLHAETDVDDPIGKGMAAYVACARQIRQFVQLRLNEIKLAGA
jgi:protein-tyrosine-phosphatase